MTSSVQSRDVDTALLRAWPLPDPENAADKDERGRVLIIGGCSEMPGAVILAALGAMRAGAGKICVATSGKIAHVVAHALPEARVISLEENARGGLSPAPLACLPHDVDALLIGPGMQDELATVALTRDVMSHCGTAAIVLDALAMSAVLPDSALPPHERPLAITPHPGEMAHLRGVSKQFVQENLLELAIDSARAWHAIVAMKSATTYIAAPQGTVWRHEGGNVGLAISGSGDVLAGIIAGLCARGTPVDQATVWGVSLHARSGALLADEFGPVGYLAREIPQHIPRLMREPGITDRR